MAGGRGVGRPCPREADSEGRKFMGRALASTTTGGWGGEGSSWGQREKLGCSVRRPRSAHRALGSWDVHSWAEGPWPGYPPINQSLAVGLPEEGSMALSKGCSAAEAVPREARQLRADS